MPIKIDDLFWGYFDRMEKATLDAFCQRVAPGVNSRPGPYGCIEGKNGPISRCCGGYGQHHFFLEWAQRHNHKGMVGWLAAALRHYPAAYQKIMAVEKHPPGEYVDIPHEKDDDSDITRHDNPSGLFRCASDEWFLSQEVGGETMAAVLERDGTLDAIRRTARSHASWLFSIDWIKQRNWHIRHHYPIQTAVWTYRLTGQSEMINAACWMLKAFYDNAVYPRRVDSPTWEFYAYDTGRMSDAVPPRHGWGSSQLTFWPWYDSLRCQSLFDLYMAAPTPKWARDLCVTIVRNVTDWYLRREDCPSGDFREKGDQAFINTPMHGGLVCDDQDHPFLTESRSVLQDDEFDALGDDEPYWPFMFSKATESDGGYYDAEIDGHRRYHHSRRYAGGTGRQGVLGPEVESSGPGKAIVDALAIRAVIDVHTDPAMSELASDLAKRLLVEQCGLMNQLGVKPYRKKDLLGVLRDAPDGWCNTAAGNNRMLYWTGNAYRILRFLEEHGRKSNADSSR